MIISFSRRLRAISLKDSVKRPISSWEGTRSEILKLPAAMARVPSASRSTGREITVARASAPPIPKSTMIELMSIVLLRAVATACSIER